MIHENILNYKKARYFTVTIVLLVACVALYVSQGGSQPANGGTWQGYILGTIAALLIVWLAALGKRKRNYKTGTATVRAWVSAHVYLGSGLLVVATLHCAAQFGYNIHTLAYLLMCLVIASGFFGIYSYLVYPRLQAKNRTNSSREVLFVELNGLNDSVRKLSKLCEPDIRAVIESAIDRTNIGGGVVTQLLARDDSKMLSIADGVNVSTASVMVSNSNQQAVIEYVADRIPRCRKPQEAARLQDLLSMLCRRQNLLRTIRRDIQLQGWMKIWLYIHVPLTIALLFALTAHIVAVFFYW
ncbi:hypothetical protein [Dasania marina]|uniref:hypothetical protein n=1 Tax=Dasania marina TaxID=471499 RepID=UPI00037D88AF|nr:hypothetical protein [Dasania marina]